MNKEKEARPIYPYEIILGAFTYFENERGVKELDLDSLKRISLAAGCPTTEVAKA